MMQRIKMSLKISISAVLICTLFNNNAFSQTLLEANCNDADAYKQIENAGYGIELPDCGHPVKHITIEQDSTLGKCVFAFTIHRDLDDDRCGAIDRQRLEIKMNDPSTVDGTTRTHQWKFKLATDFKPGSGFFHIHQIKAQGGKDEGSPLITLTTRAGNPEKMQLIYSAPSGQSGSGAVHSTELEPFKGKWVQVTEVIKYSSPAIYSIVITQVSDGATLFSYSSSNLMLTRSGAKLYRPKYGLYRSLKNKAVLRDETILFADFIFSKNN